MVQGRVCLNVLIATSIDGINFKVEGHEKARFRIEQKFKPRTDGKIVLGDADYKADLTLLTAQETGKFVRSKATLTRCVLFSISVRP